MPNIYIDSSVERVELPDGLWWDLKRRPGYFDKLAIQSATLTIERGQLVVQNTGNPDVAAALLRLVRVATARWNLPDPEHPEKIAPITEAVIAQLEDDIINPVLLKITELYRDVFGPGAVEKKSG